MADVIGYDLDGVLTHHDPADLPEGEHCVCISGRTFAEYDARARQIATTMPLYIRGAGAYGDWEHAGLFKATMCEMLGVTTYYEDDPRQAAIIRENCLGTNVVMVAPPSP